MSGNTKFGNGALNNNQSNQNSAFGYNALYDNTDGYQNTSFGSQSLENNVNGINNTSVGYRSIKNNIQGNQNTILGSLAGDTIESNRNTLIGFKADVSNQNANNQIAVGSYAINNEDNTVVLGDSNVYKVKSGGGNYNVVSVINGDSSPINNIDPDFAGQLFIDTLNENIYMRYGLNKPNWKQLNDSISIPSEGLIDLTSPDFTKTITGELTEDDVYELIIDLPFSFKFGDIDYGNKFLFFYNVIFNELIDILDSTKNKFGFNPFLSNIIKPFPLPLTFSSQNFTDYTVLHTSFTYETKTYTYQIILFENGSFEFRYGDVLLPNSYDKIISPFYTYDKTSIGSGFFISENIYPSELCRYSARDNQIFNNRVYTFDSSNSFQPSLNLKNPIECGDIDILES